MIFFRNTEYLRTAIAVGAMAVFFFLPLSVHCANGTAAGAEPWRWVRFGTEVGVPPGLIGSLYEAEDSSIWAGSTEGVLRFDGYQWNSVDSMLNLPTGKGITILRNDEGTRLVKVSSEELYLETESGFKKIVAGNNMEGCFFDGKSILVHIGDSLFVYSDGKLTYQAGSPAMLPFGAVPMMWRTRSGDVWINASDGIYLWEHGTWNIKLRTPQHLLINSLLRGSDRRVIFTLLLPIERRGVWELRPNGTLKLLAPCGSDGAITEAETVDGETYALYSEGAIRFMETDRWSDPVPFPITEFKDIRLCLAHDGNLWVGTNDGIFCYRRYSSRWTYLGHSGTQHRSVNELIQCRDGTIWTAGQRGIEVYKNGEVIRSFTQIGTQSLSESTGLIQDRHGNVWISSGSRFTGAYRWDGSEWKAFPITDNPEGAHFHKIRQDRQGNLWFLGLGVLMETGWQPGAYMYDGKTVAHWGTKEGLPSGRVYAFAQGKDGALWFGTYSGISRWKNGTWTHWTTLEGSSHFYAFALGIDSSQNVWFSDRFMHIGYIDQSDAIHQFSGNDELPNDVIWEINTDSSGTVWVTTEKGPASYQNGRWSQYDAAEALSQSKMWPILPLGSEVYFGTFGGGIVCLHPAECVQPTPRIYFNRVIVEGDDALLSWRAIGYLGEPSPEQILTRYRLGQENWTPWSTTHEFLVKDLSPGSHYYQVQTKNLFGVVDSTVKFGTFSIPPPLFLQPAFLAPIGALASILLISGVLYIIRIKNKDKALVSSEAKFRRLTESTFDGILIHENGRILEANERLAKIFGFELPEFLTQSIRDILPNESLEQSVITSPSAPNRPFETTGKRKDGTTIWLEIIENEIPYAGFAARIAAFRNITERKLAEEQLLSYQQQLRGLAMELSNAEERERRQIATYLHDYISQALVFCKMKLGSLKGNVTDRDIQEIRLQIEEMFEMTQSLTFELSPPILHELGLEAALGSLTDQMREKHQIEIRFISDPNRFQLNEQISQLLFHSVRELLINVIKHADASAIDLKIDQTEGSIKIEVTDDGKGFTDEPKERHSKSEGGFGLFNIRERITNLGGELNILPGPTRGTTIVLTLPLTNEMTSIKGANI
jgi:PAS domain S-box-containing protein